MFAFLGLKLVHTSKVMTNVASSGVNYWDFSLFFFSPQCSLFCLFHFSSCLVPPLRCSLYWNSNGSRVCVWPARAVIEPICRLAPVGLNPGLTALRWLNAFAMFLKPILFLLPPPTSLDNPPNVSPSANKFFIEIDALSFHWVGNPPECILHILFFAAWHGRFMCWKKKSLCKGSWWSVGGMLSVVPDWSVYGLPCTVLRCWNFHPRFNVWYVWVERSLVIYCF